MCSLAYFSVWPWESRSSHMQKFEICISGPSIMIFCSFWPILVKVTHKKLRYASQELAGWFSEYFGVLPWEWPCDHDRDLSRSQGHIKSTTLSVTLQSLLMLNRSQKCCAYLGVTLTILVKVTSKILKYASKKLPGSWSKYFYQFWCVTMTMTL